MDINMPMKQRVKKNCVATKNAVKINYVDIFISNEIFLNYLVYLSTTSDTYVVQLDIGSLHSL